MDKAELLELIAKDDEVAEALAAIRGREIVYAAPRYVRGERSRDVSCRVCRHTMRADFTYCGNCGVQIASRKTDSTQTPAPRASEALSGTPSR